MNLAFNHQIDMFDNGLLTIDTELLQHEDVQIEELNPLVTVAVEEITHELCNQLNVEALVEDDFCEESALLDAVDERMFTQLQPTVNAFAIDNSAIKEDISNNDAGQRGALNYMNLISTFSLLTAEEEISLARRVQQGDEQAINKLISCNLKLVVSQVKKYLRKGNVGLDFCDLVQEGNMGVMHAATKFDPERGFRFTTYAVYWIRQKIQRAINYKSLLIAVPAHVKERIYKAKSELESAIKSGVSEKEIETLRSAFNETVKSQIDGNLHMLHPGQDVSSLDISASKDESMPSLGETIADLAQDPERRYEIIQCIEMMQKALNAIYNPVTEPLGRQIITKEDERLEKEYTKKFIRRQVFELYSGLNENFESFNLNEIGEKIKLTRERTRQIFVSTRPIFEQELLRLSGGFHNLPIPISFATASEKKKNRKI